MESRSTATQLYIAQLIRLCTAGLIALTLFAAIPFSVTAQEAADPSASITLRDETSVVLSTSQTFDTGSTTSITSTDGAHTVTIASDSALAVLVAQDTVSDTFTITDLQYYESFGSFFLNCIEVGGSELCGSWQYTVNGEYPSVGLDQYTLSDGDDLFLFFGSPRKVEAQSVVTTGEAFTATALEFDTGSGVYAPVSGYTIGVIQDNPSDPWNPIEITTQAVDGAGEATFTLTATGTYKLGLQEDYYYPTVELTVEEPEEPSISLTLRDDTSVVLAADQPLTEEGTAVVTSTDGLHTIDVASESALVALVALDEESEEFAITDLQYYESFGSFFLNCIEVGGSELCGSWQYTVNGHYPSVGLDQYMLSSGDSVFLFYGSPRVVEAPSEAEVNTPFTAAARVFNPQTGLYEPLTEYTIGVIQDNPSDPWNPIEITTQAVDGAGEATFTLTATGTYKLGLQEDYYYPTVTLNVTETVPEVVSPSNGGGGSHNDTFGVDDALAFLASQQQTDGSFGAPLYSDWAAIALASDDAEGGARNAIQDYIISTDSDSSHVTDHERRAMALMALGVSPYDGTRINHIEAILEAFDGTQIGEANQINDDIFALIVLRAAGYSEDDSEIVAIRNHVLAAQKSDGSWSGTVDMTAATIQALNGLSGVSDALADARAYLVSKQESNGGFGNSFSTSWAIMAIVALDENPNHWKVSGNDPLEYLADAQENDGGVEETNVASQNRIWATSYAVPAALEMTWMDIMEQFTKPEANSPDSEPDSGDDVTADEESADSENSDSSTPDSGSGSSEDAETDADSSEPTTAPTPQVRGAHESTPAHSFGSNPAFSFLSDGAVQQNKTDGSQSEPVSDQATENDDDTQATTSPTDERDTGIPTATILFFGLFAFAAGWFVFRKK